LQINANALRNVLEFLNKSLVTQWCFYIGFWITHFDQNSEPKTPAVYQNMRLDGNNYVTKQNRKKDTTESWQASLGANWCSHCCRVIGDMQTCMETAMIKQLR